MLKNMCCEAKKSSSSAFFVDGPFVDLGLDHSFDIKFFWGFCPFWNQKNVQQKYVFCASKGTVREHGTDSTKGGHPSPKSPGACVILPWPTIDARKPQVNNPWEFGPGSLS